MARNNRAECNWGVGRTLANLSIGRIGPEGGCQMLINVAVLAAVLWYHWVPGDLGA
jgi:hypothetical protein